MADEEAILFHQLASTAPPPSNPWIKKGREGEEGRRNGGEGIAELGEQHLEQLQKSM